MRKVNLVILLLKTVFFYTEQLSRNIFYSCTQVAYVRIAYPPIRTFIRGLLIFLDNFTAYRTTHYKLFNYPHQILLQPVLLMNTN